MVQIIGLIIWIVCLVLNIMVAKQKNRSVALLGCFEYFLLMDCIDHQFSNETKGKLIMEEKAFIGCDAQ